MPHTAAVDMEALQRLVERHRSEFAQILGEVRGEAAITMSDRFGRSIAKTDKVITPAGEAGVVIRLDKNSDRVLIRLDDSGTTRMLKAHRVEVARGRPRKNSLRVAAKTA